MKVSVEWLREFVDFDLGADELADLLLMSGTAVERIDKQTIDAAGVVVAEVVDVKSHPNAENLMIATVYDGKVSRRVVCGAPNLQAGMKSFLALPGARLPDFPEGLKSAVIRGVRSEGMLLSPYELRISDDRSVIVELDDESVTGTEIGDVIPLSDVVLDLEITPNRPDCMSILGVAREISTILDVDLRLPEVSFEESGIPTGELISLEIEDKEGCPRYTARTVTGVNVKSSPPWMQRRITACGLRPINNVVDVTNYVLLELGQPLHAFDLDLLKNRKIIVRKAGKGEIITTLDGIDRQLDTETLVIADSEDPVAIAGIMGGESTEVSTNTRNVLIESAHFDPTSIFLTSKRFGLRTEASSRFERGTDPEGTAIAARRAAHLILKVSGGEAQKGEVDVRGKMREPSEIKLRKARVFDILGTRISVERIKGIISRLGGVVSGEDEMTVRVPSFRRDLTREIDLIEEIARIHGYDCIPSTYPAGGGLDSGLSSRQLVEERFVDSLVGQGLLEIISYSFMRKDDLDLLLVPDAHPLRRAPVLLNPLAETGEAMRTTLMPGLLRAARLNFSRGNRNIAIFEKGRVFFKAEDGFNEVEERDLLGILLLGSTCEKSWLESPRDYDFYELKGILECSFDFVGMEGYSFKPVEFPWLIPGRSAGILVGGRQIGFAGQLFPDVSRNFGLEGDVMVAEISMDFVDTLASRIPSYKQISKYPGVKIDIAVLLDASIPAGDVLEAIRTHGGRYLAHASIFDVYQGEQVPQGKKSLAFSLEFSSMERTLREEEAMGEVNAILEMLSENFKAQLRGTMPEAGGVI